MRTAYFSLPGRPKTFKAIRVRHGRNVYAAHTKEMKDAKKIVEKQKPVGPAVAGKAIRVHASLHFKRPKSQFKSNGNLKSSAPKYILKRPDIDNCLKFILDSLQPAVIVDDKLVVEAKVVKYWCKCEADEKSDVELIVLE